MQNRYGYVRVSSKEQNEERQLIAMREQGISDSRIYVDKQSGKDFERPMYKQLMRKLKKDDVLFVHSIDRLGRNYREIIEQWTFITSEKQVNIVVLDMPLLDTRAKTNDLTGVFISNLVLQILSYVAQKERENIRKRQAEGIAAARARGVTFGRKPTNPPDNFDSVAADFAKRYITADQAAERLGVSKSLLYKWVNERGIKRIEYFKIN